jgi:glycerophosphoryl diester phosphodiesterase
VHPAGLQVFLVTPLATRVHPALVPAAFDASGKRTKAASALCCTSDLTLAEFKSLAGKMDALQPQRHDATGLSR